MSSAAANPRVVGRYALYGAIAAGGMATVHLGRLMGPVGFSRTVAIKRLHAQFAADPEFVSMFLDEARLAARIRHPNVVPTLDVVATGGELFLVMDYVPGESVGRLSRVLRDRGHLFPLRIVSATMSGVLHGLHAAHEAKDERGHPLGIVHRDMSPQNVILGTDGVPRVLDFGVAKAAGRVQTTKEGQIKGKLSYMPPEQLRGADVSRKSDIYAAGVMLWELVTGQRLFNGDNEGVIVAKVLEGAVEPPSAVLMRNRQVTFSSQTARALEALDATVLRALAKDPEQRFATAREMALELERKCPPATASEVGDWVESIAKDVLSSRAQMIAEIESSASMALDSEQVAKVMSAKNTLGPASASAFPVPPTDATRADPNFGAGMSPGMTMQMQMAGAPGSGRPSAIPIDGPPVTQPSSISVSARTGSPEPARGRAALAVIAGVAFGVVVLGGFVAWRVTRTDTPTLQAADPVATSPVPTTSAATTAPPIPTAIEVADAAVAAVEPPPSSAPSAAQPKPRPTAAAAVKPIEKPTPAKPVADCNPPYYYEKQADGQQIKKYKPECIK